MRKYHFHHLQSLSLHKCLLLYDYHLFIFFICTYFGAYRHVFSHMCTIMCSVTCTIMCSVTCTFTCSITCTFTCSVTCTFTCSVTCSVTSLNSSAHACASSCVLLPTSRGARGVKAPYMAPLHGNVSYRKK